MHFPMWVRSVRCFLGDGCSLYAVQNGNKPQARLLFNEGKPSSYLVEDTPREFGLSGPKKPKRLRRTSLWRKSESHAKINPCIEDKTRVVPVHRTQHTHAASTAFFGGLKFCILRRPRAVVEDCSQLKRGMTGWFHQGPGLAWRARAS